MRVGFLLACEFGHEFFGTAFGNRTEVLNRIGFGQTNAIVGNREGFGGFIEGDLNAQIWVRFVQFGLIQTLKAQFIAGIGGV